MKNLFKKPQKAAYILFVIALLVRLSILLFFDNNSIALDGTGYHRIAVNLVKGNGFSNIEVEPYEKSYFREPGYPFFLAGIYSIINIFHPVQYIENFNIETYKLDKYYPEIIAAKTVQIILDSFGVVLLFLILMEISNIKIAFLTSLLTATFFNLAFYSVNILRETLVVFLLLGLNFFYVKYILKENMRLWLLLIGITIGLLILVFKVHIFILPVLFVLMFLQSKRLKKSILHASIVTIVAIFIILPHNINVYRFYPDVRVFKTFGNSFTYEMGKYTLAIVKLEYYGILSHKEGSALQDWNKNSKEQFEKSFNGYYLAKADSMNSLVKESLVSKRKIEIYFTNFRKSFFLTKIGDRSGKELINTYGYLILIPLVILPVLIGIFGIIGLFYYGKKYLFYLLPFLVYLSLFWILGDEYRRMIILQPFLIFFGLLLLNKILEYKGIHWLAS